MVRRFLRMRSIKNTREGRHPPLLRKRILSCSSSFRDGKKSSMYHRGYTSAFAKATADEAFVGPDVALA
jgi:hypothetical protein